MQLHERVKQERIRLGMNLESFAEIAQAKARTLIDWESGKSSPTAKQLALLAEYGVNTNYVITGNW
jgi:transcriptional regulator with XRE-family HTH domain